MFYIQSYLDFLHEPLIVISAWRTQYTIPIWR